MYCGSALRRLISLGEQRYQSERLQGGDNVDFPEGHRGVRDLDIWLAAADLDDGATILDSLR